MRLQAPSLLARVFARRCWLCWHAGGEMRRYWISGQRIWVCPDCQEHAEGRGFPRDQGRN